MPTTAVATARRVVRQARWLALLTTLTACSGDGTRPPAGVASVTVSAVKNAIEVGETLQLSATAHDAKGAILGGRTITFETSNASIATVTPAGVVAGVAPGAVTLTARSEGRSGTLGLTVTPAAVAFVGVTPGAIVVKVGTTTPLVLALRDARGATLAGRTVAWVSSDPTVASVDGTGRVSAVAPGHASIMATVEGRSGVAELTVVTGQDQNLTLDGLYLTQAVQRFDGTVPLVAGGLPILVNVFGTIHEPLLTGSPAVTVRVRVLRAGAVIAEDARAVTGTIGATVNRDLPIHQVVLPSSVAQPGISVIAEIDPAGAITETTRADNVFPRSGVPQPLDVRTVPPLAIHFVPIFLSNGGSTGNVTTGNVSEYLETLHQVHPVSEVTTTIGATLATDVNFGGGELTAWSSILQQLDARRVMEGATAYYYGVLRPPPNVNFVSFGGIGYVGTNPNATGPATRTAAGVTVGWFFDASKSTQLVAHELGHNMGRQHAPCGGAGNPDLHYPYPNGVIGAYGHDLYTYSRIGGGIAAKSPTVATDVMGYCTNVWVSDYTYEGILNFRAPATATAIVAPDLAPTETVIVSGVVDRDSLSLSPVFSARTRPSLPTPDESGPYTLEGLAADARVLFRFAFTPRALDHATPDLRHFSFAIPLPPADRDALARVRVARNAVQAELRDAAPSAAAAAGGAASAMSLARLPSGLLELRWDPRRWPAVLIRDPETRQIIGMGRTGRLTLPSTRTTLEVTVSSGLHSETRTMVVGAR